MNLREIHQNQEIRFLSIAPPSSGALAIISAIKGLRDRYSFLRAPQTVEDFNLTSGASFGQGVFQKRFAIDRAAIFGTGLVCEVRVSNEQLSEFILDLSEWLKSEIGFSVQGYGYPSTYHSGLEVSSDQPLNLDIYTPIAKAIDAKLVAYGHAKAASYETVGFSLGSDPYKTQAINQSQFSFARREGHAYDQNIYYSVAPLTVTDHMELLQELEKQLLA
jgi:hypothetical protein